MATQDMQKLKRPAIPKDQKSTEIDQMAKAQSELGRFTRA